MVRIRRPGLKFLSKEFGFESSISIIVIGFQSLPLNNKSLKTLQWKDLKGHVTRFSTSDFFTNQFPRAPEYPIRAASNCCKNWHRYLHLKCQRLLGTLTTVANGKNLQWEKFKYLVWTPLGSRVNIYINQCGGSGMFILDPGSWFLPIPDPGSKNSYKREGWKKNLSYLFLKL
jgi:hypothetical protein